ncbi:molybdopterin-containing oxidoreductase catalytic subunit [Salmonella enterica subsp. enterica]|nr:molybdopterin-containing oxidoreductase catalytic subunit [Salmonella enterica subsp. enterica]
MKYIYQGARERGEGRGYRPAAVADCRQSRSLPARAGLAQTARWRWEWVRHLVDKGLVDQDFVNNDAHGYPEFEAYLRNHVTVEWASEICGLSADVIRQLAEEFTAVKPATVWIGYGMQASCQRRRQRSRYRCLCRYVRQHRCRKAAARVMVICTPGALTTAPCCRSRREGAIGIPGSGGHHQ